MIRPGASMMSSDEPDSSRRNFIKGAASLAPLAALVGTGAGAAVSESSTNGAPAAPHPAKSDYSPTYFTPDEWAFLNAACARLIPKDEHGPGAVDLGVPQYIDRQMSTAWADGGIWYMQGPFQEAKPEFGYQSALTPKQQFRLGIKAIDTLCQTNFGKNFAGLSPEQQDDTLHKIEKGELTSADIPLKTFFTSFLLKTAMEGYFGDPMYGGNKDMAAWIMIAYPGVRADYLEWVGEAKPYPYGPVSIYGQRS
jgi:gluconate 2-dehydrogenase gamma chain